MTWTKLLSGLMLCLLAACNLQVATEPAPPSVTQPPALETTPTLMPSRTPANLPTLLPTPIQIIPGQEFTDPLPVTLPAIDQVPENAPTVSAALADDRYEVTIGAGETVGLNYEAEITRGSLSLVLQGPGGVVWQRTLTASETTRVPITVQIGGDYELLIFRQGFDGSYSFHWD